MKPTLRLIRGQGLGTSLARTPQQPRYTIAKTGIPLISPSNPKTSIIKPLATIVKKTLLTACCVIVPSIIVVSSVKKENLDEAEAKMTETCNNNPYKTVKQIIDRCTVSSPFLSSSKGIDCFEKAAQACQAKK